MSAEATGPIPPRRRSDRPDEPMVVVCPNHLRHRRSSGRPDERMVTVRPKRPIHRRRKSGRPDERMMTVRPKRPTHRRRRSDRSDERMMTVRPKRPTHRRRRSDRPDERTLTDDGRVIWFYLSDCDCARLEQSPSTLLVAVLAREHECSEACWLQSLRLQIRAILD